MSGGTFSYLVSDLDPGSYHSFQVETVKGDATAMNSSSVEQTTPLEAPMNVAVTNLSSEVLTVTWDTPGDSYDAYNVYSVSGGIYTLLGTTDAGATSFAISDVTPGNDVQYAVMAAWDDDGDPETDPIVSDRVSTEVTTVPVGKPASPGDVSVAADGAHALVVTWTNNSSIATGFTIQRQNADESWSDVGTADAGATSFTDSGDEVYSASAYSYRVIAKGDSGGSGGSDSDPSGSGIGVTDYGSGMVYTGAPWDDADDMYHKID